MINNKFKIILFTIGLISLLYTILNYEKDDKLTKYLNKTTKSNLALFNSTYAAYEKEANLIYKLFINQDKVIDIYKDLQNATDIEKDILRETLYLLMKNNYATLAEFNVRQLHFHLSNNDSFLRMHKPQKYGDNLTDIRETVAYVNMNHKSINGFEEGRIYNGFRYVFPITGENGNHLGSVENSYNSKIFTEELANRFNMNSTLLVSEKIINKKVFQNEKLNYLSSPYQGFYYDKEVSDANDSKVISQETINKSLESINMGKPISIYDETVDKVTTYIPIKNPITNKVIASLIIKSDHPYIKNKLLNFYMSFLSLSLLVILIIFFIYREAKNHKIKRDLLRKKNAQMKEEVEKTKQALSKSFNVFSKNVIASDSDTQGAITYVSEALCRTSGFSKEELIGQQHSILLHVDNKDTLIEEILDDLKVNTTWAGEIKNTIKGGGFYWTRTAVFPKYDDNNQLVGYSSIWHDITSEKVKDEFMANMSHELRTPLNAIIGFSSILEKKQTEPRNKELSQTIHKSAQSLLGLINNILDLAKIDDSHFTLDTYDFDAYKELSSFSEQFEGLTHKKILNYTVNLDDSLKGVFYGDWDRISQIILNLLSNAIKFTPKDGLIEVSGDYKNDCFTLSVADNGIGMNKEVQDKIFKPFSQADGSTTRKYGGTGLGLSITQNLVELMGGRIELESQEGVGSTFKINLPLERLRDEGTDVEPELSEEDKEDSLEGHILIVEDNKTNQMLVKMLITDFGLTCDVANDGLEAIAIYDPLKHQLVLMDENMPNLNGLEAMKVIREKYKKETTPIIALTANTMKGDRERFLSLGMDEYLPKPIDEDELHKTLKSFL